MNKCRKIVKGLKSLKLKKRKKKKKGKCHRNAKAQQRGKGL